MLTERDARFLARRHPEAAHKGWLLASDAPEVIAIGERMILTGVQQKLAILYRDYCANLYATKGTTS